MRTESTPLEPRELRFIEEYLIDLNGTQAALRAGFSEGTARHMSAAMLKKPNIHAEVVRLKALQADRLQLSADKVLRGLIEIASVDIAECYDENGKLKSIREIPKSVRHAIAAIESEDLFGGRGDDRTQIGTVHKVKFWPKVEALVALGKHLKLFVEQHEHKGTLTLEQLIGGVKDPDQA